MDKICYLKCVCTTAQRQLAIRMRQEGYTLRMTNNDREAREEADTYGIPVPFKVEDGVATQL